MRNEELTRNKLLRNSIPVPESGCWIWEKFTRQDYGRTTIGSRTDKSIRPIDAHRASYMVFVGDIPEGLNVLHKCDVPSCVNPNHLFLGTYLDNMQDKAKKGRAPSTRGEINGNSKLNEQAVKEIRNSDLSGVELAKKYNMSKAQISDIRNRKSWRHLS